MELDVTAAVTGNGVVSFAVVPDSTDGVDFRSREAGTLIPELVVQYGTAPASPTFTATADARVNRAVPDKNYPTQVLRCAGAGVDMESYLAFSVTGLTGTVTRARLRVYANTSTVDGPEVWMTGAWSETGITWNNRPVTVGSMITDSTNIPVGWYEFDVTSAVTGNGSFSFELRPDSNDSVEFASRETAAKAPVLIVETTP